MNTPLKISLVLVLIALSLLSCVDIRTSPTANAQTVGNDVLTQNTNKAINSTGLYSPTPVTINSTTGTDSGVQPMDLSYDRSGQTGILISAWQEDSHGISPATVYSQIQAEQNSQGYTFAAVKITYGNDLSMTPSTLANNINTWVNYFSQYYSNIYVASREVFHTGRKMTQTEATNYYYAIALVLNQYASVKAFLGEEEPEAKQVDPWNGNNQGNNLAYSSATDMENYIAMLYNTWHTYSTIPFTFESIPPETDDGTTITNPDCWFFGSQSSSTYWNFIDQYQDIYAIDEWRYHVGVQDWADHVDYSWYNPTAHGARQIIIGETFNLDVKNTEQLMDAFYHNYGGSQLQELRCAFWWMECGSEADASGSSASNSEPYVYFNGGYEGHNWAFLNYQTISPNSIAGNGIAVCQTYTNDPAQAYAYGSGTIHTNNENYFVRFNLDASSEWNPGNGGNSLTLGFWYMTNGKYFRIDAQFDGSQDFSIVVTYPNQQGSESTWTSGANAIVPNVWSWLNLYEVNGNLAIQYGWEDPVSGTCYGTYTWANVSVYTGSMTLTEEFFGACGGNICKMLIGQMAVWSSSYGYTWNADFESNLSGFSPTYPNGQYRGSTVFQSGLFVNSHGSTWDLTQLRYGADY